MVFSKTQNKREVETGVTHTPLLFGTKNGVDFATHSHGSNKYNYTRHRQTDTCTKGHTICYCVMQLSIRRNFLIYTGICTNSVNS